MIFDIATFYSLSNEAQKDLLIALLQSRGYRGSKVDWQPFSFCFEDFAQSSGLIQTMYYPQISVADTAVAKSSGSVFAASPDHAIAKTDYFLGNLRYNVKINHENPPVTGTDFLLQLVEPDFRSDFDSRLTLFERFLEKSLNFFTDEVREINDAFFSGLFLRQNDTDAQGNPQYTIQADFLGIKISVR